MKDLVEFFHKAGALKDLKRSGWLRKEIKEPESVADHSWRTALITLVLAKERGLDAYKAVTLAVVHDLAEALVGDYIPGEIPASQKAQKEREAINGLCRNLSDSGKEIVSLWEEAESRQTPEALLVKEVDRLEMALQAKEYEQNGKAVDLSEFVKSAEDFLKDKGSAGLLVEIKKLR